MYDNRRNILHRYSPFSISRSIDNATLLELISEDMSVCKNVEHSCDTGNVKCYYQVNEWESDFFKVRSVALKYIVYYSDNTEDIRAGIEKCIEVIKAELCESFILTIEIPAEDNILLQILNDSCFRTIETRLHLINDRLSDFEYKRFEVRDATVNDIPNLKRIASFMRNPYDRFHSDWNYDNELADKYLSTYIENSILGFADLIIVPNASGVPPDSFLTANVLSNLWDRLDFPVSRMILSAVSSETNRGWYVKLISEMTYRLRSMGAKAIFMTTQSTNIPVLVTWEKLGYKIGRSTSIVSKNIQV